MYVCTYICITYVWTLAVSLRISKMLLEYTVESWIGVTLVISCSIIWLLILLYTSLKYGIDKSTKSTSFTYFILTTVNINLRALINKGAHSVL